MNWMIIMNITNQVLISTITTIIIGIFIQLLNHYLSSRREKKKEVMESLRKFAVPHINTLIFFLKKEIDFRNGHYENTENIQKKIFDTLKNNIEFSSPTVSKAFLDLKSLEFSENNRGFEKQEQKLKLFYYMCRNCIEILTKSNKREYKSLISSLERSQYLYGVWSILYRVNQSDHVKEVMNYYELWWSAYKKPISRRKLHKLLNKQSDKNNKEIKNLLQKIEKRANIH